MVAPFVGRIWEILTEKMPTLEPNGGVPVNIQDQTSPTVMLPMVSKIGNTTLSADAVVGAYSIEVTSVTGIVVGHHIRVIEPSTDRYYYGHVLAISAPTITLDTKIDHAYSSGAGVTFSTTNMNVDGSVTPVTFTLRTGIPSIPSSVDITKMAIRAETATAVDLNKFGDLTALTRGLAFRRVNDEIYNIFNVKTNADLACITDFEPFSASNPALGQDGFIAKLNLAGSGNIGVALRIEQNSNLEMIVQDDLTGLVTLKACLIGHAVEAN